MHYSKGYARKNKILLQKQQFLTGNPMICSLDLAKKKHAFRVSDRSHLQLAHGHLSHVRDKVEELLERLETLRKKHGYDRIVFFMEGASHFWMTLASLLERRGYAYRLVLNQAVKHQRHLDGQGGDYNDPIDAGHIGDLGRELHFTFSQLPKDPDWIRLRALACEFQELVDLATAEKNRIHAFLETSFPDYYQYFADPFRPTSLATLRGLPYAGTQPETDFVEQARKSFAGKNLQVKRVRKVWQYVHTEDPWGYVEAREPLAERLSAAAQRLQIVLEQQTSLKERLLAAYRKIPYSTYLDSIPNSSPTQNAVLLGILGDPRAFDEARTLVHLAGLNPGMRSSGTYQGQTRITKVGRERLRRAAISATIAVMRAGKNREFVQRFFYLQNREDRPLTALQALCACAAKYLRTVWWLCVNHTTYSPQVAVNGFWDKKKTQLNQLLEDTVMELIN
jgi:transposase